MLKLFLKILFKIIISLGEYQQLLNSLLNSFLVLHLTLHVLCMTIFYLKTVNLVIKCKIFESNTTDKRADGPY